MTTLYDDGRIACDDEGVTIKWYYLWGRRKIPYSRIRSVRTYSLSGLRGKWRIWGSGDFLHWYNLDPKRPNKEAGIELDLGRRILPCITPDDADAVARIIESHLGA